MLKRSGTVLWGLLLPGPCLQGTYPLDFPGRHYDSALPLLEKTNDHDAKNYINIDGNMDE